MLEINCYRIPDTHGNSKEIKLLQMIKKELEDIEEMGDELDNEVLTSRSMGNVNFRRLHISNIRTSGRGNIGCINTVTDECIWLLVNGELKNVCQPITQTICNKRK